MIVFKCPYCDFTTKKQIKKKKFHCKCGHIVKEFESININEGFPLDCKFRGKQIAERTRYNCGCNGVEPVYVCSFSSPARKCVRSKYKDGKPKEVVCLYCKDYECSIEPIGNQST